MHAGSSADELEENASDLDCAVSGMVNDMDDVEVDSDVLSEEDSDGVTDDEDCDGPQHVDKNGNFVLPQGYELIEEPPYDQPVTNLQRRGYKLGLKWPYGHQFGWVIGNFKKIQTSGQYTGYYVIRWQDGDETYWPKEPRAEYGPQRKWVLIKHIN